MKFKIVLLMACVYGVTLIAHIPAGVLGKVLPPSVTVNQLSGTLWQGQAAILTLKDPQLSFKKVQWDLSLWRSLLNVAFVANFSFSNGAQAMAGDAQVEYARDGLRIINLNVNVPADTLVSLAPMPLPVTVGGKLSLSVPNFTQGSPYCAQLEGALVWHNAAVNSQFGDVDLASPQVTLSCDNGNLVAVIAQQSSQLRTQLTATLLAGNRYQVKGEIEATETLPPAIAQSLSWVGKKNRAGATLVNLKGKL